MGVLACMVLVVSSGILPISLAAFAAVGVLILTRCISATKARQSVDWSILIVIAAGLGLARAMEKTGAATAVAHFIVSLFRDLGPTGALVLIYLTSHVMAELLHHSASVAIAFPIAVATAHQVGAEPRAFVMAVAIGAVCSFASPVAYQTHLIVYGAGRYRFSDFLRVGLPLNFICGLTAILVIPRIWPF
jgi:di/tricarboxylate transporter